MNPRTRYQFGSVTLKKRAKGADVWEFRYYETQADGKRKRKATFVGTTNQYRNKSEARVAVEALLLKLNEEKPQHHIGAVTFGGIIDRYIEEELPQRYSTRKSYLSNIKLYIRPRWERYLLHEIRPMVVEGWLKNLDMAPKSKAHIRGMMHIIFECASRWELFNDRRNPIQMVRVKGGSKRLERPTVLTVEEYETLLGLLQEPARTMVTVAQCLGLRASEIAALQWDDFDFDKSQLLIQRSCVNGRIDDAKTEYSRDFVPLHESLVEVLLEWSKKAYPTEEGWVFASPYSGRPYHSTEIQKRHIQAAGSCLVECPICGAGVGVWCSQAKPAPNGKRLMIHPERKVAAGRYGRLGWHTFRHTYRSWLDETGAPMKVQQELMRHASIQTTMNVYGQAMPSSKREANSKIVELVLKPVFGEGRKPQILLLGVSGSESRGAANRKSFENR